jgi:hypothetical protein
MIDTGPRVIADAGHAVESVGDETTVGENHAAPGTLAPDSGQSATRALLTLRRYQIEAEFAAQWERRHPLYARLLNAPVIGARLRTRRARYLGRMMAVRGIE